MAKRQRSFDSSSISNYDGLSKSQKAALDVAMEGNSMLISGAAGTGKSHVLHTIIDSFVNNGSNVAVTSSTGISAVNLGYGAITFHSFIGCGFCSGSASEEARKLLLKNKKATARWKDTDVLIIDEISMIGPLLFEKAEEIARIVRDNTKPFGGIQVICCGDWAQLLPVPDKIFPVGYEHIKKMSYCFETHAWDTTIKKVVILSKNFRQKDDSSFLEILEQVRVDKLSAASISMLKSRVGAKMMLPKNLRPTVLYPTNNQVDEENKKQLDLLPYDLVEFHLKRTVHGNLTPREEKAGFEELSKTHADEIILLKINAVVILTINLNTEIGLVNGLQGVVVAIEDGNPVVQFSNRPDPVTIEPYKWWCPVLKKNTKPTDNDDFRGVCIQQIPLKLAFAMTIHKSQSLTLHYVILDLGKNVFAEGQAYTGVSRCSSLNGLSLVRFHPDSIKIHSKVVMFYKAYSAIKDDGTEEDDMTAKKILKSSRNNYSNSQYDASDLWTNEDDVIQPPIIRKPKTITPKTSPTITTIPSTTTIPPISPTSPTTTSTKSTKSTTIKTSPTSSLPFSSVCLM